MNISSSSYGVWGDWDHPYLTLDPEYEAAQIDVFGKMALQGYIYRGRKPVHWSPSSRTALAEAELEYPEGHVSKSMYAVFRLISARTSCKVLDEFVHNLGLAVWITTLWTIPANVAVAINPKLQYAVVEVDSSSEELTSSLVGKEKKLGNIMKAHVKPYLVVALDLVENLEEKWGVKLIVKKTLANCEENIYRSRTRILQKTENAQVVIGGDYITTESGTGLVHTAPGHGHEDYITGLKYDLPVLSPVDDGGILTEEAGQFSGLEVLGDGNIAVIERLDKKSSLIMIEPKNPKFLSKLQMDPNVLQLWVSSVDYTSDVVIGPSVLHQMSDIYRKLRGTLRFLLRNLHDWKADYAVPCIELPMIDRYALFQLESVINNIKESYDNYQFFRIFQIIQRFVVVDLSNFYLDVAKDRLWGEPLVLQGGVAKQSLPNIYFRFQESLLRFCRIWPRMCEEKLRTEVKKVLEIARTKKLIGSSLESKVYIHASDGDLVSRLVDMCASDNDADTLHRIFLTSQYPEGHVSKSMYAVFRLISARTSCKVLDEFIHNLGLAIWTTTPWTIPANAAVAINPKLQYAVVEVDSNSEELTSSSVGKEKKLGNIMKAHVKPYLVVALDLAENLEEKWGVKLTVKKTFTGAELEHCRYVHPIENRECPVVIGGDYITTESGTGLVHTAPGHGHEDYITGLKYDLPVFSPVDDGGIFTEEAGQFSGLDVLGDGNIAVIECLDKNSSLIMIEPYKHKYPYDWRTKKPTIFRATEQWFASVEGFRNAAMESIDQVTWTPPQAQNRISAMTSSRSDWCISRQRTWGVPIPVFYHVESKEPLMNEETIDHIKSIISQKGSDAWWYMKVDELLPEKYRNEASSYVKGTDTMDVWCDSGSSWAAVLAKRDGLSYPADLSRGYRSTSWLVPKLIVNEYCYKWAPYRGVITHGFVLDEKGFKMSKSLGNVVDPRTVIEGGKDQKV
ncbi:hypothetical protein CASFOL_005000 [Castilleja foliolosa]|uniref:isoleucine--tRNA ligase n=1 Tax=Castilleja foliolosa TaxID=1961234 RepID=A0ABD3E2R7_9LAMI